MFIFVLVTTNYKKNPNPYFNPDPRYAAAKVMSSEVRVEI